ncbi:hypothetical protein AURDEDRAFT_162471 [Auricularia subglabra TFB-10046 SS5]|nr:hypothetical protein AURDEDRAFT_162471 [Auricularia subglabra TFB-10046 SS5]
MEDDCNPTIEVKSYVADIKAKVDSIVWDRIAIDEKVQNALTTVATIGSSNTASFRHATSYLLNCISNAYLYATKPNADPADVSAIVFSSSRDEYVPGDYLGAGVKADLTAFMGDVSKLASALNPLETPQSDEQVKFPHLLAIGELEAESGLRGEGLWYLSALLRYRPDLSTVHGLLLDDGKMLRLVSLNACGSWSSDPVALGFESPLANDDHGSNKKRIIPSTDSWIAYVVLLYLTHAKRDARFSLTTSNGTPPSAHWTVNLGSFVPTVRPFYATFAPGKMTWASFALEPSPSNIESPALSLANGFLKTSWQDVKDCFHESKMLTRTHKKEWLPGLVRPWSASLHRSRRISLYDASAYPHVKRQQEIVYLASLGHPLSQCRSALHLLKTVYDAAETHYQLAKRGILHGDMSWFNVLCNPWHDDATLRVKPAAKGIPCIDFILSGDAETSRPCALVLDLDNAAKMKDLYSKDYAGGTEKTGTPIFISVELSSKTPVRAGGSRSLRRLAERLAVLDERPELFARAFPGPDGDHNFMENFLRVVDKEEERAAAGECAFTNPGTRHLPLHDVESLYWILVWGFSRACPVGEDPHGMLNDDLSQFVDRMLEHRVGEPEGYRNGELYGNGISPHIFHYALRATVYPVLQDLATYLAIPWNLYVRDLYLGIRKTRFSRGQTNPSIPTDKPLATEQDGTGSALISTVVSCRVLAFS